MAQPQVLALARPVQLVEALLAPKLVWQERLAEEGWQSAVHPVRRPAHDAQL